MPTQHDQSQRSAAKRSRATQRRCDTCEAVVDTAFYLVIGALLFFIYWLVR